MSTEHDAEQIIQDLQLRIAPTLDQARTNLAAVDRRAVAFIRERPVTCIVGALALGFVVGKLAARL